MRFSKAQEGVKLIFFAEIVALVVEILGLCYVVAAALLTSDGGSPAHQTLLLLRILIGGHLSVGFFILFFTGMNRARQDEPRFGYAMLCLILALAAAFVGAFVIAFVLMRAPDAPLSPVLMIGLLSSLTNAMSCVTMLLIASGVRNLAKGLGDSVMVRDSARFQIRFAALCGSSVALNIVSALLRSAGKTDAAGAWIPVLTFLLSCLSIAVTLRFLGKAGTALSR